VPKARVPLKASLSALRAAWDDAYGATGSGESLIQLLPEGTWPTTGTVQGRGTAPVARAPPRRPGGQTQVSY